MHRFAGLRIKNILKDFIKYTRYTFKNMKYIYIYKTGYSDHNWNVKSFKYPGGIEAASQGNHQEADQKRAEPCRQHTSPPQQMLLHNTQACCSMQQPRAGHAACHSHVSLEGSTRDGNTGTHHTLVHQGLFEVTQVLNVNMFKAASSCAHGVATRTSTSVGCFQRYGIYKPFSASCSPTKTPVAEQTQLSLCICKKLPDLGFQRDRMK